MKWLTTTVPLLLVLALAGGCHRKDRNEQAAAGSSASPPAVAASSAPAAAGQDAAEVAVSILPREPRVGDQLKVVVPGGGGIREISWYRNGSVVPGADSAVLPANSTLKGEEVSAEVTTDRGKGSASVTIADTPPTVIAADFVDPQVHAGKQIEIVPRAEDEDGDEVTGFRCVWAVNGEILSDQTSTILSPEYFHKGDRIKVEVFASDGEIEGPPFVGKEFIIPNAPPRFVTDPPKEFSARQYVYQARAEDPDGDPLKYRLEAAPAGMTIDANGKLTWSLDASATGEHHVRIVAEDDAGAKAVQDYTLRIAMTTGGSR